MTISIKNRRFLALLLSIACGLGLSSPAAQTEEAKPPEHHHDHGGGAISGVASLDVYADGPRLHILTSESVHSTTETTLLHRHSEDGGATWSPPAKVNTAMPPPFMPHRGMDPQIAAAGDHLIAVWTTPGTDEWGSGPMATALSEDGGKTWKAGPNPADDHSTTGHGFMDIAADSAGAFHLAWLDSRDGKQGLRYTRSRDFGETWAKNATLKAGTCECCANAIATGPGNAIGVLFRDQNPRDMKVISSSDQGTTWLLPNSALVFNWKFNGCPHEGGGIAFSGQGSDTVLHTVIWSGLTGRTGVYYTPAACDDPSRQAHLGGDTAAHPDIAADQTGRLAAVWDESDGTTVSIKAAISPDEGKTWGTPKLISAGKANATNPKVAASTSGFRIFWTEAEAGQPTRWVSATLP